MKRRVFPQATPDPATFHLLRPPGDGRQREGRGPGLDGVIPYTKPPDRHGFCRGAGTMLT
jgi:hypothetical protein